MTVVVRMSSSQKSRERDDLVRLEVHQSWLRAVVTVTGIALVAIGLTYGGVIEGLRDIAFEPQLKLVGPEEPCSECTYRLINEGGRRTARGIRVVLADSVDLSGASVEVVQKQTKNKWPGPWSASFGTRNQSIHVAVDELPPRDEIELVVKLPQPRLMRVDEESAELGSFDADGTTSLFALFVLIVFVLASLFLIGAHVGTGFSYLIDFEKHRAATLATYVVANSYHKSYSNKHPGLREFEQFLKDNIPSAVRDRTVERIPPRDDFGVAHNPLTGAQPGIGVTEPEVSIAQTVTSTSGEVGTAIVKYVVGPRTIEFPFWSVIVPSLEYRPKFRWEFVGEDLKRHPGDDYIHHAAKYPPKLSRWIYLAPGLLVAVIFGFFLVILREASIRAVSGTDIKDEWPSLFWGGVGLTLLIAVGWWLWVRRAALGKANRLTPEE